MLKAGCEEELLSITQLYVSISLGLILMEVVRPVLKFNESLWAISTKSSTPSKSSALGEPSGVLVVHVGPFLRMQSFPFPLWSRTTVPLPSSKVRWRSEEHTSE